MYICKEIEENERFSIAVYCNCMAETNFYFTEALINLHNIQRARPYTINSSEASMIKLWMVKYW